MTRFLPILWADRRSLAFAAFFLSGASSLIFQTIWTRMLHHVFGATSVAISTVLTVFMAGLGLGAYLGGRYAARIRHPLITYALAELAVGVFGLLIPWLVTPDGWLASVNAFLRTSLGAESSLFMLARFVCVVPILLLPTTLMGASLPLLTRHFVGRDHDAESASSTAGALYAVNTLGAAVGPLLSAFVLMPSVGLAVTNLVACSMNFVLAAVIWMYRRPLLGETWVRGQPLSFLPAPIRSEARPAEEEASVPDAAPVESAPAAPEPDTRIHPAARWAALLSFGASGAAALTYEVVWSRALAMTIGSSIYSFALILETFLVGIAVGSATMASLLAGRRRALLLGGLLTFAMVLLSNLPWALGAAGTEGSTAGSLGSFAIMSALFSAPIVFIALWAVRGRSDGQSARTTAGTLMMAAIPVCSAGLGVSYFTGQLPLVILGVVISVSVFLGIGVALRREPVLLLALMQLFIALATTVSYAFQDEIPLAFAQLVVSIPEPALPDHVGTVQFFMFLTAVLCTLPATLGMGAMFPIAVRLWTRGGDAVARDVGTVYTSNTVGSIVGAWLPGFVLFAAIGAERTLHCAIALNLLLSLAVLIAGSADEREADGEAKKLPLWHAAIVYILSPSIPALLAVLYLMTRDPQSILRWDRTQMTLGVFRVSLASGMLEPSWGRPKLLYYRDGLTTTVSVEQWGQHYALKNNGKVDASNGDDMPTQINVAAYPLLLHPRGPEDLSLAVVGFGSGVTVGTALKFPVEGVDVIELERAIPEAARYFDDVNHLDYRLDRWPFVEMERLRVINDDGRNFLASTDNTYDIIISEPSNPWITGVSDLFTADHFRISRKKLRPDGIYCQWVQLYELSPENIKTIYRTFASEFSHVMVLAADDRSSDTVMLGSDRPIELHVERVRQAFAHPGVQAELERAHVFSPHDLFARLILKDRAELMAFTQIEERWRGESWVADVGSTNALPCEAGCRRRPVQLNTDDNARIELAAPRDLIGFRRYEGYLSTLYAEQWPYGHPIDAVVGAGEGPEAARVFAEIAMSMVAHGRYTWASDFIERSQALGRARQTLVALEVLTHLLTNAQEPTIHIELPTPGPELSPEDTRRIDEGFSRVKRAVDERAYPKALRAMERIPADLRRQSGPGMRLLFAYLLYKASADNASNCRSAIERLEALVDGERDYVRSHPELYYFLAKCHSAEENYPAAAQAMRSYVETRVSLEPEGGASAPNEGAGADSQAEPSSARESLKQAPATASLE